MADIILIIFIALFAAAGAKKGLIKTLFGAVSTVISIILSMVFYKPVSEILYKSLAGDLIRNSVSEIIKEKIQAGQQLPVFEQSVETLTSLVVNAISFVIVVLAVKLLIIVLSNVLNIVSKLPVIKQANKLLGMAAGVLSGIIVCYIVIGVIATLGAEGNVKILQESIQNSYLAVNLYENNMIAEVLSNFTN